MKTGNIFINGTIYNPQNLDTLLLPDKPENLWQNEIYNFLKNWFDNSETVSAQTSGSTGKPKSILLSKQSMVNSARMTNRFFGLESGKTALLSLPASYIAGKMMLVRAMSGGFNLLTVEPKANPFEDLNVSIDFASITPYQLHHSADSLKMKQVKNIIVGGGHVNSTLELLAQSIPSALYETYGMTETCSHIALRRLNGKEKSDCFTTLEGVTIRRDERDCLAITAPHLLKDEIQTNDMVELIGLNSFRWLGRADSVVNSGGIKIHPEQVEKKLEGLIPSSYFISSIPDEVLDNKVVLVIESEKYTTQQEIILKAEFENKLGKYEMPRQIFYLPRFIYSSGNKVLRKETLSEILKG